jgi:ribosomal protein S18 acetylase RimI-like enzyme
MQPMQSTVPAYKRAAFCEFAAKLEQRLGHAPTEQDLKDWDAELAKTPSEVDIAAFLESTARQRIDKSTTDARQRKALIQRLVFTCAYGKKRDGRTALPFDEALSYVLNESLARGQCKSLTAVAFRRGRFGQRHTAVRAAAFPYKPACVTGSGDPTVDAFDETTGAWRSRPNGNPAACARHLCSPPPLVISARHLRRFRRSASTRVRARRGACARVSVSVAGELIGYIAFSADGYIDDLSVLPASHGCGVARGLVTKAAQLLAADGVDSISLHVRALNRPAIQLYTSLGLVAGDNEFPPWYDYHGGERLPPATADAATRAPTRPPPQPPSPPPPHPGVVFCVRRLPP